MMESSMLRCPGVRDKERANDVRRLTELDRVIRAKRPQTGYPQHGHIHLYMDGPMI